MNYFGIDLEVQRFINTMVEVSRNLSIDTNIQYQQANSNTVCRHFFSP
jgi:hypothetical protein